MELRHLRHRDGVATLEQPMTRVACGLLGRLCEPVVLALSIDHSSRSGPRRWTR